MQGFMGRACDRAQSSTRGGLGRSKLVLLESREASSTRSWAGQTNALGRAILALPVPLAHSPTNPRRPPLRLRIGRP